MHIHHNSVTIGIPTGLSLTWLEGEGEVVPDSHQPSNAKYTGNWKQAHSKDLSVDENEMK